MNIRTVVLEGEHWAVLADVAAEYSIDPRDILSMLNTKNMNMVQLPDDTHWYGAISLYGLEQVVGRHQNIEGVHHVPG